MEPAKQEDQEIQSEVQCTFRTSLPAEFAVDEDVTIQLSTASVGGDLSQVVK